jgi:hypothetical protein
MARLVDFEFIDDEGRVNEVDTSALPIVAGNCITTTFEAGSILRPL